MKIDAWHLPWQTDTAPNALLDVIRGCNISCDACYNTRPASRKSVAEVEKELDILLSLRKVGSVALIGGEVLLHPQLCELVRLMKSRGLCVQICTNGVLLDDKNLSALKEAGLDMVTVHIDRGQKRPDLPPAATRDQIRDLWQRKTDLIAKHGLDVGLTMTAFENRLDDVREIVSFAVDSVHVNYLLVTLFRDMSNFDGIQGDLISGMRGKLKEPAMTRTDNLTNVKISEYLRAELGMRPFCYLGSNLDKDDPRWLSYLVVVSRDGKGDLVRHNMKVSGFERTFLALSRAFTGKYPMYRRQRESQTIGQIIMNGFTGGYFIDNMRFLVKSWQRGGKISAKRVLFQYLANIESDGRVSHCISCPDAIIKDGKLVPVCICDWVNVRP